MRLSSKKINTILNQVPVDYYDQGIKNNPFQKYWHSKKWRNLKKFLKGQSGKLLDIGCADGTTTYQIHKNFPSLKITGLDYYEKAVDFARKTKPSIKFIVGDAHKLPFKNKCFDTVTVIETLEHLENPKQALCEIYRVLKPKGCLILIQDTDSLLFRLVWWLWTKWKGSVWNHSHINCAQPGELFKILKSQGFKIRRFEYSNLRMEIFVKAYKSFKSSLDKR